MKSDGLLDVIVTLKPAVDADAAAKSLVTQRGGVVNHVYKNALNGYAASISDTLLPVMRGDARVQAIEFDQRVSVSDTQTQTPTGSWGQDRVDQRGLPLDDSYRYSSTGVTGIAALEPVLMSTLSTPAF